MTVPGELNRWAFGTCHRCGDDQRQVVRVTHAWTGAMGTSDIVEDEHLCCFHYGSIPTQAEVQELVDQENQAFINSPVVQKFRLASRWLTIVAIAGVILAVLYHAGRALL